MDDGQRQPRDSDREALVTRIRQAGDEGRISPADCDIRLGNVRSATSVSELDLMNRELDQLDAAMPPRAAGAAGDVQDEPWSKFEPAKHGDGAGTQDIAPDGVSTRVIGIIGAIVVAIALVVAGVVYVGGSAGHTDTPDGPDPRGQSDPKQEPGANGGSEKKDPARPARAKYALTAPGIRGFLQTYHKRFGTSHVVDLTLYGKYAVVNVPVPGKARQEGWLYRQDKWTSFGGVRAVLPGARVVNLDRLDIAALVRNIRRARRKLNVEKPDSYVIVRFTPPADDAPKVYVYVSNQFNENGYLATGLDGRVERVFPYSS